MATEFAQQLQRVREASGRSLRELERSIHVSSSSLSRYLTGQAVPPWSVVVALCKLTGHDPRPLRELWEAASSHPRPAGAAGPASPVRNDLPFDIPTFTGRRTELAALLEAARTSRIVAIDGMAGVGKTALAVHAAHRLAAEFPDGQLYLDLQGFTPGREPTETGEALRVLLGALDVAPSRIPADVEERAALWRSELAGRRAVIVLDNAADAAQVRPLLPGAGTSLALITSRRRMVALESARPVSLDVLPPDDAAALFFAAVGDGRAEGASALTQVLQACGHLPLALNLAAARLRHRPAWTVDTLLDRLGDDGQGTSGVFEMSLRQLDPAQRRMFRILGLIPGADIDPHAAAALAGLPLGNARSLLDDLLDAHLVQETAPNRYRQHDLLRELARTAAATEDSDDERRQALTRLLDHYLGTASTAVDQLYPNSTHLRPRMAGAEATTVSFGSSREAAHWLAVERSNLIAAAGHAADHEFAEHATRLAATLYRYLYEHGHYTDSVALHTAALNAGRRSGNQTGEVRALIDLAWVHVRQGDHEKTFAMSSQALELSREIGFMYGEARSLTNLGAAFEQQGQYEKAQEHYLRSYDLCRELGDRAGEAILLSHLGVTSERQGEHQQAEEHLLRALDLFGGLGDQWSEQAVALCSLARVYSQSGRQEQAREKFGQALDLCRKHGYRSNEAEALNGLAEIARTTGNTAQAVDDHEAALAVATDVGSRLQQARAHDGLARANEEIGNLIVARDHGEEALVLYTELRQPEADAIRAFLSRSSR